MANIRHKGQTTRAMTRAGGGAPCCEEGERRAHFARGREVGEGARLGEGALFADARTQTREDGARAAREDRAARERPPRRARGARRAVRLGRGAISRAPARRAHPQRHKRHRGSHLQTLREEGNRVLAGPPETKALLTLKAHPFGSTPRRAISRRVDLAVWRGRLYWFRRPRFAWGRSRLRARRRTRCVVPFARFN